MAITPFGWINVNPGSSAPPGATQLNAAGLESLSQFIGAYTDTAIVTEKNRALAAEALLAPKASPTFTGTVIVPTLAPGTSTAGAASTAFVTTAVANVTLSGLPTSVAPPTISGNTSQSSTLTALPGSWVGAVSYAYQWQRSGVNISGATGSGASSTYVLVSADVANTIDVVVTATNTFGSATQTSISTPTIVSIGGPTNTPGTVLITGTATQGSLLTVSNGTWTNTPVFSYQWNSNGVPIAVTGESTTLKTYTLQATDVGTVITCTVTALAGGVSASVTSPATGVVQTTNAPVNVAPPQLS
jgi:hypothetical protein